MRLPGIFLFGALLCATSLAVSSVQAEVRLPALFSDHMVLQRDAPCIVWGWADAGEKVTVRLAGQEKATQADAAGKWQITLDRISSTERLTLTVAGTSTLTVNDVLAGEVWLCSGQSNMGVPLSRAQDAEREIAAANDPQIRFVNVPFGGSLEPAAEAAGTWEVCSPQTVGHATAVGYFFGRELRRQLNVPIGLIHSSVGGTAIEGWIRRETLDTLPELRESTAARLRLMASQPADVARFPTERDRWEERYHVRPPPNKGFAQGWADPAFDDRDWKTVAMPARWADAAGVQTGGVFWLRKEVTFPAELAGKPLNMNFNFMHEQYDTAYFNGEEVGHSGDEPPMFYLAPRRYIVPGRLAKAGKNVIALRIVSASPRSDLLGRGAYGDYDLPVHRRTVGNQWRLQIESLFPSLPPEALKNRPRPNEAAIYNTPTILYNAMIHPLLPYPIRGVVWYQGESNASRPALYYRLFPLMIADWRRQWGEGDFPFYFVQLASYLPAPKDPNEDSPWTRLREAQASVLGHVPHTGMAVTIDIGEGDNIHPENKQDVGRRLALAALAGTYGRSIEFAGPTYAAMGVDGDQVRVRFTHAAGLRAEGGSPRWFAIAGEDRKFHWAEARIDGDCIVVSSPEVKRPVAVRYAWANNPEGANVFNAAGLPAAPFRSDDW